jgi:hypothetical protein
MLLGGGGTIVDVTEAVDWGGGMLDEDDVVTVGFVGTLSLPELPSLPHPTAASTSPAASTRMTATRGAGRDTVDLRGGDEAETSGCERSAHVPLPPPFDASVHIRFDRPLTG